MQAGGFAQPLVKIFSLVRALPSAAKHPARRRAATRLKYDYPLPCFQRVLLAYPSFWQVAGPPVAQTRSPKMKYRTQRVRPIFSRNLNANWATQRVRRLPNGRLQTKPILPSLACPARSCVFLPQVTRTMGTLESSHVTASLSTYPAHERTNV